MMAPALHCSSLQARLTVIAAIVTMTTANTTTPSQ